MAVNNGMRDAIREVLRDEGKPMTVPQIVARLKERGFEFVTVHPSLKVYYAMLFSQDMDRICRGKWMLLQYPYPDHVIKEAAEYNRHNKRYGDYHPKERKEAHIKKLKEQNLIQRKQESGRLGGTTHN